MMTRTASQIALSDLTPLTGPLAAVETVARAPTGPVAHLGAKIIHVMNGRARIETASGELLLSRGDVLVLTERSVSSIRPDPWLRSWTVYVDEAFFRQHMRWAIPEYVPLVQGVPPSSWDRTPLSLRLTTDALRRLEPILRRMSVTNAAESHTAAATVMALFAQAVEVVVPCFFAQERPTADPRRRDRVRRSGNPPVRSEVRKAVGLFEERLTHPWRMSELAAAVALSDSQLCRLFRRHLGLPPMRMLAELRLTEFVRLIGETELTITEAARRVGWNDPRLASERFSQRYGVAPSRYRTGT